MNALLARIEGEIASRSPPSAAAGRACLRAGGLRPSAKTEHQYENRFIERSSFAWTSQNQMTPSNPAGQRVLEHEAQGRSLHLFVKPGSHDRSVYLSTVTVQGHTGSAPMSVTLRLRREAPMEVFAELHA